MGSYLSRNTEIGEEYPPRTPVGAIFRAILEQKDRDFSSLLLPFPAEEVKNEYGETPLEYLLQLSLTQKRFNILCTLLEKQYACGCLAGEEGYKILLPLMTSCNSLATTYVARLLLCIDSIPLNAFSTNCVPIHRLFCEYGLADRITLLPKEEEETSETSEISEISEISEMEGEAEEEEVEYTVLYDRE